MSNFSGALKAELFKIFKSKGLYIILAILLAFTLLITVFLSSETGQDAISGSVTTVNRYPDEISGEPFNGDVDLAIASLEAAISDMENSTGEENANLYYLKSQLAVWKYFKANNIEAFEYETFGLMLPGQNTGFAEYLSFATSIATTFLVLYAIIIAATAVCGEKQNGTMKLLVMRPVTRRSIYFAKYTAILIAVLVALIACVIIFGVVGMAAYGIYSLPVIMVFNATNVVVMTAFTAYLLQLALTVITIAACIMGAMFLSVVIKSRGLAIFLVLVVINDVIGITSLITLLTSMINANWLLVIVPANVYDLSPYFMLISFPTVHAVWVPLALFVVYTAAAAWGGSYLFKRQDL